MTLPLEKLCITPNCGKRVLGTTGGIEWCTACQQILDKSTPSIYQPPLPSHQNTIRNQTTILGTQTAPTTMCLPHPLAHLHMQPFIYHYLQPSIYHSLQPSIYQPQAVPQLPSSDLYHFPTATGNPVALTADNYSSIPHSLPKQTPKKDHFFRSVQERCEIMRKEKEELIRVQEQARSITRLLSETENAKPPPSDILERQPPAKRPQSVILPGTVTLFQLASAAPSPAPAALSPTAPSPAPAAPVPPSPAAPSLLPTLSPSPAAPSPAPASLAKKKTKKVDQNTFTNKQKRDMLVLIKDNKQRNNACLTQLEAIHLIEDRMGLKLKTTFILKLRQEVTKYLQVRTLYEDGLKRGVKDRLEELSDKLEEFYEEMNAKGATITDKVLITEAKEITSKSQLPLPKGFNFSFEWLLH